MVLSRMQDIKRVLLTGGGTAGHVNPALAIGSIFTGSKTRFLFVGTRGRVEENVVPREGIPIQFIRASGYPGKYSPEMVKFLLNLLIGSFQSIFILLRFRPEVIIGTGGYVAAPITIAAAILKKTHLSKARIFMHEQNAVPGKLNRVMGRFADKVFVTFPETLSYFPEKGTLVGYPLRKTISRITREEAFRKIDFKVPEGRKTVLVFGGSQGSRNINRALIDALEYLLPFRDSLFIIHGVGLADKKEYNAMEDTKTRLQQTYNKEQLREIETFYTYKSFFYHIEHIYALCDIVLARAGAGSLNEISAMGLPALIIPKSNLPGNHQVMNARSMERAGAVEILYEQITPIHNKLTETIDGKILADRLLSILQSDEKLKNMSRLSRSFFNQDALIRIEKHIDAEKMIEPGDDLVLLGNMDDLRLPNNHSLLMRLEKEAEKHRHDYEPERIVTRAQDLEYLKNRACFLLMHPSWHYRNLGIKLLGLLGAKEKIPVILELLFERKPVPWFKKLLGGDYEQVGFIRRNIFITLIRLNEFSPEIEKALLTGLSDPYYEVRAQAAHAVAVFGSRLASPEIFVSEVKKLLFDPHVDVVLAAAEALGQIGGERDALPALLEMWDSRLWKVRAAVLRGILHLVKRGLIENPEIIEEQAEKFILTSTDFRPHFEIKAVYRHLMELVAAEKEKRIAQ
jgi:UDP-N-acetylglucosamine--N-acetylmuramyl-(pentapeptide) pyrophosphoryl-undecaprenol N-acetylglucosamine transferase